MFDTLMHIQHSLFNQMELVRQFLNHVKLWKIYQLLNNHGKREINKFLPIPDSLVGFQLSGQHSIVPIRHPFSPVSSYGDTNEIDN